MDKWQSEGALKDVEAKAYLADCGSYNRQPVCGCDGLLHPVI